MVNIFVQTGALVRKNALVLMRSPFQLAMAVLMPLVALFIAVLSSNALANNFKKAVTKPASMVNPPVNLVEYSKCSGSLQSCPNRPRVFYAPTDPYHSKIIESLAADIGLTMGTDVFGFPTIDALAAQVAERQVAIKAERKVNYAITFTTFAKVDSAFGVSKGAAPVFNDVPADLNAAKSRIAAVNGTHYSLWQLSDMQFSMDDDASLPNILYASEPFLFKHQLDLSITKIRAEMQGVPAPSVKLSVSHFPLPAEPARSSRGASGQGQDAEKAADGEAKKMGASFTAGFILFGFSPLLLVMANLVGNEKHSGLIGVLRKLGMSEAAYWLATFVTGSILVVVSSILALVATPAFPEAFQMYNWSPIVTLSLFIVTGLHMVAIGLLIVALLTSPYAANLIAGFVCMICILGAALIGFTDSMLGFGTSPTIASGFQSMFDPNVKGWILMTLFPFVAFGKAFSELSVMQPDKKATLTFGHPDFTISRTFTVRTLTGKYNYTVHSTQTTFIAVLLLSIATISVAMYFNQVQGGPRPFWFPLSPTYWGFGDQGDAKLNAESKEEQSLIVRNLKKTFSSSSFLFFNRKTVEAVKDVSFTVRKGRVLSLLGTNGAGKSTSINMITGLTRPTSGYVSCFGTGSLSAIQQQIGVTAQSDVTWPLLTAADHIRLFAAFKGVASSPSYIQDRLLQVGLEGNGEQLVGTFSGGMRRRLCIVTCSIGEPALCILDEPTSSLDPINRRKVWKFIQSLKAHAAVVLVTHLLDEADALGDEICIIDGGHVKAQGSSLALKSRFGSGYECIILAKKGATTNDVTEMVRKCVPAATVTQRSTEMFAVTIPTSIPVTPLVRFLRSSDPTCVALVESWEISNATLEGVFLAVAEQAKAQRESLHQHVDTNRDADVQESFDLPKFVPRKTLFHQVAAVFLKDWKFQLKQLKATIVAYLMIVVFLGLFFFARSQADESICDGGYLAVSTGRSRETTCDLSTLRQQFVKSTGICSPDSKAPCTLGDMRLPAIFGPMASNAARYWVQDPSSAASILFMENQGVWAARQQFVGSDIPISAPSVTKVDADPITTIRDNLQRMYSARKPLPSQCISPGSLTPGDPEPEAYPGSNQEQDPIKEFSTLLPDFGIKINSLTPQGSDIHFVVPPMPYNARYMMSLYKPTADCKQAIAPKLWSSSAQALVLSTIQRKTPELSTQTTWESETKLAEMLQAASVAQLRTSLKNEEGIFGMIRQVPKVQAPTVMPLITSMLLPMALYSLFSAYLQLPFQEKEAMLFEFYRVQGLTVAATWLGHWLFALSFTLVPLALATALVVMAISTINVGSFLVLSLLAIHGSIAMAFLLAALLTSTTMARLISFLFPPVAAVLSGALTFGGSMPSIFTIFFPPLPFAFNLRQLALTAAPAWGLAFGAFAMSTLYLFVAIALMAMADRSPLEQLKSRLFGRMNAGQSHQRLDSGDLEMGDLIEDEEDDEVRKERVELTNPSGDTSDLGRYAVKAVNVEKAFGSHRVLKGLNMSVAPGVTYGLLGHNGCGKSTLLNILMGSSRPTAGNAWVGGQLTTTRDLSSIIGVCPQQDMVIGDLTVLDNLTFFARLRGAPLFGSELDTLVRRCAELVGLKGALDRQASALSGGMRRRLSIGIAVIGSPQVLMLDEPSGGLDAANRLGVWRLLGRIREQGKTSVIITTHYMEEADALCSRIGIMAGGRMRVLGNQVSLKNKYGNGYVLHMQLPVAVRESSGGSQSLQHLALRAENGAMDVITATLGSQLGLTGLCIQHEHQDLLAEQRARGGSFNPQDQAWSWEIKIQVPLQSTCDLASVFELMAQGVAGVKDWGITQSSLEDIFISVSNKYYQS